MGIIVIQVLILIILWFISCALSFLIGRNAELSFKKKTAAEIEINKEDEKRAKREAWELNNMLTYDGTPQEKYKGY